MATTREQDRAEVKEELRASNPQFTDAELERALDDLDAMERAMHPARFNGLEYAEITITHYPGPGIDWHNLTDTAPTLCGSTADWEISMDDESPTCQVCLAAQVAIDAVRDKELAEFIASLDVVVV